MILFRECLRLLLCFVLAGEILVIGTVLAGP